MAADALFRWFAEADVGRGFAVAVLVICLVGLAAIGVHAWRKRGGGNAPGGWD